MYALMYCLCFVFGHAKKRVRKVCANPKKSRTTTSMNCFLSAHNMISFRWNELWIYRINAKHTVCRKHWRGKIKNFCKLKLKHSAEWVNYVCDFILYTYFNWPNTILVSEKWEKSYFPKKKMIWAHVKVYIVIVYILRFNYVLFLLCL